MPYDSGQIATGLEGPLPKSAGAEARAVQQPSLLKRVQEMLGVRRIRSDQDLVRLVEERLDIGVLEALRQSGLTDDEIYSLIVPRRTLTHRRARHEALSREESDRAMLALRRYWLPYLGRSLRGMPWIRQGQAAHLVRVVRRIR